MSSASSSAAEREIEQHEDDEQRERHDVGEPRLRALEVLELARPRDRVARRQLHVARDGRLRVAHDRNEVAAAHVDVDPARQPRVLALQHRRTVDDAHARDRGERQLRAALGDDRQHPQRLDRIAQLARIADVDRKAREAFDRLADVLAADRGADHVLHVGDRQPVARRRGAVDRHVEVAAAFEPLGERRGDARHVLDRALDLPASRGRSRARSGPETLMPTGLLMPVASMSMRLRIGGTQTFDRPGTCTVRSSSSTSLSVVMPGAPLALRLELDRRLDHLDRRRIGRRLGAADLAEHARDLGHRLDHPVGLLQELGRLARGQPRQRRRHVQQVALVERRHELAAELHDRPRGRRERDRGDRERRLRPVERRGEQRPVARRSGSGSADSRSRAGCVRARR